MKKKRFILDLCVIMNAATLLDSENRVNTSALAAITNIINRCDQLVLTNELEKEYFRKLDILQKNGSVQMDITKLFLNAYSVEGKIVRKTNNLQPVAEEELIPKNDRILVRLAQISHGIIVTSDGRLNQSLKSNNFEEKYGVKSLTPEEVNNQYI